MLYCLFCDWYILPHLYLWCWWMLFFVFILVHLRSSYFVSMEHLCSFRQIYRCFIPLSLYNHTEFVEFFGLNVFVQNERIFWLIPCILSCLNVMFIIFMLYIYERCPCTYVYCSLFKSPYFFWSFSIEKEWEKNKINEQKVGIILFLFFSFHSTIIQVLRVGTFSKNICINRVICIFFISLRFYFYMCI